MISRAQIKSLIKREPGFEDITCSLRATVKQPKGILKESKKVMAIARKFTDEVVRPMSLELDKKMHEDPEYLPWEYIQKVNEWGLYTMFIPKIFGGQGYSLSCLFYLLEEIGTACLAMSNLIGVHYLGYASLISSWNMKMIDKISRDVARGEKTGEPCIISLAITEPNAGTDSQNIELMDTGNLACHAQKTDNGYIINGTKIFISSGHLSTWHIVHAYTDLKKGSENTIMFAVKTGSEGFSFGRKEKKMGQKACVASELIFNNCFVPDENVCIDNRGLRNRSKGIWHSNEQILAYIWGASRIGVSSFGAGAARGAYETALKFASETEINGQLLINHEWCQCMLADMYINAASARIAYTEGNYANGLYGLWKILNLKPLYYLMKYTHVKFLDKFYMWLWNKPVMTLIFRKLCLDFQKDAETARVDGWGSLAKVLCTDAGVKNCMMAIEIMGQAGIRHDRRAEKILRDAKLLQIYEGTNQINRINVFKRLIAPPYPQTEIFTAGNI
ncbi:MAG: acyl-CoA/acyl-ACP dehydrogenase [Desulfobacteraceae bacterium]|nr:acyl-CoA/acyl-ACP dehydrogenase [Desulfobacteraceae bacterium]MBC2755875.1 acyl-CoA/acyl-ACP dehydrogenase [Desulfobacteraceae bacterium]MBC2763958.1 acyl-CoA/acyl-ACP dehydrogenase [ANME-2 cluster archaeon]